MPGQVWKSNRDGREIIILDAYGRQTVIRFVETGGSTTCDVSRFNRSGTTGFSFVREATERERRQWGCA